MTNKYNMFKAGVWYTVGNLIIKGIPFFSVPIFVRILSTADFGIYNTYIAYESILSIIFELGFSGTVKTAKFEFDEDFETYISSIYTLLSIFFIIVLPLSVVFKSVIKTSGWFTVRVLIILLIHSFANAIFNINGVKFVINGQYKLNLLYTFISTILNIGLSLILCLYIFNAYFGRILGTAVSYWVIMFIILLSQYRKVPININKKFWNYALQMGLPLIPHLVSVTLLSSCDKIMIQKMVGSSEAGIYSLAVNLVAVLSVFLTSIENAWAPWFYSNLHTKNYTQIKERNTFLIWGFAYLTSGFCLVGPELIAIFSTKEYTNSIFALVPLSLSIFLNFIYLMPVNLEYFNKRTLYISVATIICAAFNIILNYFFIKYMGYIYAAHATCLSKLGLLFIHYFVAKKIDTHSMFNEKSALLACIIVLLNTIGSIVIRWGIAFFLTIIVAVVLIHNKKIGVKS